jgi:isochorismate hydrolase
MGLGTMVKRIRPNRCIGVIVDFQGFFLAQLGDACVRSRMEASTTGFARLLGYFRIPIVATLERPVRAKGSLPPQLKDALGTGAALVEKDFFDLTKEKKIVDHLAKLKKKQMILTGCETDVCILQSCLGLLDLGYDVFVVEDLLFSSARNVDSAIARMKANGAIFLTYKTLFYELVEAVEGGCHAAAMQARFGPFPKDFPEPT